MSKCRSNLVLWFAGAIVLACCLSASATTFYYPTSGAADRIMDPANWNSERDKSGFNPISLDFANAANEWVFFDNKYVMVAPNTNPATHFRIAGPVTYRNALGVSGVAADRNFLFNGSLSNTSNIVATFDDLRIQGTIEGRVTRMPYLAGNLSFIADANGKPAHSAFQVRTGNPLNITALVDASECNSIDVLYYLRTEETTADSQISLRNGDNRIYSKFVLDAGLYGNVAGSLGDADVEINGGSATDARGGKLTLQAPQAISATAKVSIVTATGMNTDPVRLNIGANNVTIRELWINNVQQTGSPVTFSSSSTWLAGTGTLTVTNTATQDLTMAVSPADPNIKIGPPVGVKAYAEGYTVRLHAPNPKNAPYKFDSWSCVGGTVTDPAAADTTVTIPAGSGISVTANYVGSACSPLPVNTQTNVSVFTGLLWTSAPSATAQTVYFGTDNPPATAVTNVGDTVSNADLGGRLIDGTTYYWFVASTIGGEVSNGPVWSFTTGDSDPHDPSPVVGVTVPFTGTRMSWFEDSVGAGGTSLYNVYLGTDQAAVSARTASTVAPDANGLYFSGDIVVGLRYYWAVDVTYRDDANGVVGSGTGPVWYFDAAKRQLLFNTDIPAYSIDGAADVNGYIQDGNYAVFKFPSFNEYDNRWNIVATGSRVLAIWSETGIDLGAAIDVSGASSTAGVGGVGVAGGYSGGNINVRASAAVSGPGFGDNNWVDISALVGAGGGFGGAGGKCGRYSDIVHGAGGIAYGEQELYTLQGGSGGAGGKSSTGAGGGAGGGAVELYAMNGNINIGSTAVIKSNGGSVLKVDAYGGGGGSGGAIRLIASGNVTVTGEVRANGGTGGSVNVSGANNTGGGGGGGRIAAYRGGSLSWTGPVTANGGSTGFNTANVSFARPGQNGTIYTSGAISTLLSAHAPIPANGNMTWSTDPNVGGGNRLSWAPGLGSLESKVYFGTSQESMTLRDTYATANDPDVGARDRIYHTVSPSLVAGARYYWRVDTNGVTGPVWSFATGTCASPAGDMDADCKVTFKDLKFIVDNWLTCNLSPTSICN